MDKPLKRYILPSVVIFLFAAGMVACFLWGQKAQAEESALYWGKSGNDVVKAQQKLNQWGFYTGPVDGIYGTKTLRAVKRFQVKNGLNPDGVVGDKTWLRLGYPQETKTTWNDSKAASGNVPKWGSTHARVRDRNGVYLLAKVIAGEARGESYLGKVAVGAVMLNRVQSSAFPNTLAGVVYQPMAFESVANGQYNRVVDQESLKAARQVMNGWDPTNGALYFWNPAKDVSPWIWSRNITMRLGQHVFGI